MANHYKTLGLTYKATPHEIKRAYRSLAKKYHPDVSTEPNAEDRFVEITEAYEILSDPTKRRFYDLTGSSPSPRRARPEATKRYERRVRKDQSRARAKAREYAKVKYTEFDQGYFNSPVHYFAPKMLGCLGFAVIGFLLVAILSFILDMFGMMDFGVLFFLMTLALTGMAYASTQFDIWHDNRQKRKRLAELRKKRTAQPS